MNTNPENLIIKTSQSDQNISQHTKLVLQKKTSVSEMSPTLLTPFTNKSQTKLNNSNTDNSINEDFPFLKNELSRNQLRKETNFSIDSNNTVKTMNFNVSLGKIQDGMVVLLGDDMNLLELPLDLLPMGSKKGNIFKVRIERNMKEEENRKDSILNIQKEILENDKFFKVYD